MDHPGLVQNANYYGESSRPETGLYYEGMPANLLEDVNLFGNLNFKIQCLENVLAEIDLHVKGLRETLTERVKTPTIELAKVWEKNVAVKNFVAIIEAKNNAENEGDWVPFKPDSFTDPEDAAYVKANFNDPGEELYGFIEFMERKLQSVEAYLKSRDLDLKEWTPKAPKALNDRELKGQQHGGPQNRDSRPGGFHYYPRRPEHHGVPHYGVPPPGASHPRASHSGVHGPHHQGGPHNPGNFNPHHGGSPHDPHEGQHRSGRERRHRR